VVGWFTFEKSRSDAAAASMLRKRYRETLWMNKKRKFIHLEI
jgi:hypothetical protein